VALTRKQALIASGCAAVAVLGGVLFMSGSTDPVATEQAARSNQQAAAKRFKAVCSSEATYDRLKQVAFDEAIRIRNADPVNLDLLSTYSLVRVENPVVKSRDETLDVTVCSGRFILEVPPGAEAAFGGKRQLAAQIEYAAQASADGSGLVYQMKGAEPIIYNLAAFDLKSQAYRPAGRAPQPQIAAAEPAATVVSPQREPAVQVAEPEAVPRVTPRATPAAVPSRAPAVQPAPSRPSPTAVAQRSAGTSPSFSCRSGRSRSEQMVCNNAGLASLDRAMSSQFYSALSSGDEQARAQLRRTRDRFLATRERCADESCVEQAYRTRMSEISAIAGGG
jgi:hypothetical protein